MKKVIIVLSLLVLLSLAAKPHTQPAFYVAEGRIGAPAATKTVMDETYFSLMRPGVVALSGNTWYTSADLIRVTGSCRWKYEAPVWMYIEAESGYGRPLLETSDRYESFAVLLMAQGMPFQIVWQSEAVNIPYCDFYFEAVK